MIRLTNILFLFYCLVLEVQAMAQITGNLNVKDPKAIEITDKRMAMLCGKEWLGLHILETKRGEVEHRKLSKAIYFNINGKFSKYLDGTESWEIIGGQFIKISVGTTHRYNSWVFQGAYSIYELSDSVLVLAQILTSSGDWVKEFTFTTSKKVYDKHHIPFDYSSLRKQYEPREGEKIKYHSNGKIASIENYGYVYHKVSPEQKFETNSAQKTDTIGNMVIDLSNDIFDFGGVDSVQVLIPIGNWFTYFVDGKMESVTRYDNNGKLIQERISYLEDGQIDRVGSDEYDYSPDKSLLHVKRLRHHDKVYLVGHKDSVELNKINFFVRSRAGTVSEDAMVIKNLSNHVISIQVLANEKINIKSTVLKLKAHDSIRYNFHATIPAGATHETITLKTLEWQYDLKINSFGYHLCAADFERKEKMDLPIRFYYYLLAEDYQLEIQKLDTPSKPKTIPFSQQLCEIELRKGKYRFTLVGSFGKRSLEVEVK